MIIVEERGDFQKKLNLRMCVCRCYVGEVGSRTLKLFREREICRERTRVERKRSCLLGWASFPFLSFTR